MHQTQNVPVPEVYSVAPELCAGLGACAAHHFMAAAGERPRPEAREAPASGLPPPRPGEARMISERTSRQKESNLQLVFAIVDENMVANFAGGQWFDRLISSHFKARPWAGRSGESHWTRGRVRIQHASEPRVPPAGALVVFSLAGFEGSKFGCRSALSDLGETALLT